MNSPIGTFIKPIRTLIDDLILNKTVMLVKIWVPEFDIKSTFNRTYFDLDE